MYQGSTEPQPGKPTTCSRVICDKPLSAEGEWSYCSAECRRISKAAHGGPLPRAGRFSWL